MNMGTRQFCSIVCDCVKGLFLQVLHAYSIFEFLADELFSFRRMSF